MLFPAGVLSRVLFSTLFSTSWVRLPMSLPWVVVEAAVVVRMGCPMPAIVNPLVVAELEALDPDRILFSCLW